MTTPKWDIPISVKIAHLPVDDPGASAIAGMFGLSGQRIEPLYDDFRLSISPGEIIAVTGPSGGGKTSLLRAVAESVPDAITLDLDVLSADSKPAIACLEKGNSSGENISDCLFRSSVCEVSQQRRTGKPRGLPFGAVREAQCTSCVSNWGKKVPSPFPLAQLADRLAILSRCGLADAKALITPAKHLSGGQLYRLALASAVWRASVSGRSRLMLIDEFASTLDSATAGVLASGLRKLAWRYGLAMIISTPRDELLQIIKPDRTIVKPLGEPAYKYGDGDHVFLCRNQKPSVKTGQYAETWSPSPYLPYLITRGTIQDYRALSRFHYLTGPPAAHKRVWTIRAPVDARRPGTPEVAAVLVVSPPVLCCRGRNVATGKRYVSPDRRASIYLLNAEIECISRVVVHPIYRSCGLAVRLVRHALRTSRMPLIEALATMGAIHPFFERGGMSAFGRFTGRKLNYNYYLAAAKAVLPRNSFNPDTI